MSDRTRSVIVTGGAGGLGAATVRHLVDTGRRVVVFDRSTRRANALVDELGTETTAVAGDACEPADVEAVIAAARALGRLSGLVNVAGGGVGGGPVVREDGAPHDQASFVETMRINAFGTFNTTRLVAAAMATNPPTDDGWRGTIVNTSSIAGYEGQYGQVAYAAAKAAILGMTLPLARDLAPLGIRVCSIAPGPMGTPALLDALPRLDIDPGEGIPFPARLGRPEEFALLVAAVLDNPYLNGENIRLDGAHRLP